mmetsp:Transcript_8865/g.26633  ORF Transcript_8865/g.26633 Transcript_8865/m.26633 type:complete len:250 (-) Transcript_8865:690-1439(-)
MNDPLLVNGVNSLEHLLPIESKKVGVDGLASASGQQPRKVNIAKLHHNVDEACVLSNFGIEELDNVGLAAEPPEQFDLVRIARYCCPILLRDSYLLQRVNFAVGSHDLVDLGRTTATDHLQPQIVLVIDLNDGIAYNVQDRGLRWCGRCRQLRCIIYSPDLVVVLCPAVLTVHFLLLKMISCAILAAGAIASTAVKLTLGSYPVICFIIIVVVVVVVVIIIIFLIVPSRAFQFRTYVRQARVLQTMAVT